MYPLMLSASALLLTAGSAAAHTSAAVHSHTEMVIVAAGALVAVGAVLARRLVSPEERAEGAEQKHRRWRGAARPCGDYTATWLSAACFRPGTWPSRRAIA